MTDTPPTDDEREAVRAVLFDPADPVSFDTVEAFQMAAVDRALAYLAPIRAREIAAAEARERARVVAWLRSLPHYANLANQIERREHDTGKEG